MLRLKISSCTKDYLVALGYVAPVFPDVVLHAIERASEIPDFISRKTKDSSDLYGSYAF